MSPRLTEAQRMRELVEWDWVYTLSRGAARLHHLTEGDLDALENQGSTAGRASCALTTRFAIPGIFSRMGRKRCSRCCTRLGYPQGTGSPKNDDACRPLVEARLAALAEDAGQQQGGAHG